MAQNGLFGSGSNVACRVHRDYDLLASRIEGFRRLDLRVVLTSGSFDMLHQGHSRYLERAKSLGDVLIVGVDSDAKIKSRKGPRRPIVPEDERVEILCHLRHVDLVMVKELNDPKYQLIRTVRPDVLVATQDTYKEKQLAEVKELCKEVVVLEPQATTTTTALVRNVLIGPIQDIRTSLLALVDNLDTLVGVKKG